ncbi:MAG: hypothetical protein QJR08_06105 [Bacillota bacterium]|nr:hypothetical protein [Bacillota bacterium]
MERGRPGVGKDLWGIGASLAALLAGFWLMVAPWALAFQPKGADWTDATLDSFWSGVGVTVVALAGVVLFLGTLVAQLRQAGILGRPRPQRREEPEESRVAAAMAPARLEEALVPLAARLLEELAAQQRPDGSDARQEAGRAGALHQGTASGERGERL